MRFSTFGAASVSASSLEPAWSHRRAYFIDDPAEVMGAAIRHAARLHGAEDKYHETMPRTWLQFVFRHRRRSDAKGPFRVFVKRTTGSEPATFGLGSLKKQVRSLVFAASAVR